MDDPSGRARIDGALDLIIQSEETSGAMKDFVDTILDANRGDSEWIIEYKTNKGAKWTRKDGRATASYVHGGITLETVEFSNAQAELYSRQRSRTLQGF